MKKGAKLAIVLLLVVAGTALAFAGAAPDGYKNVSALVSDPMLIGQDVEVKAAIVEGSLHRDASPISFAIADASHEIPVRWDPAIPLPDDEAGGTIEGKNVVVIGTLQRDASTGQLFVLAKAMQVGCASKYRAA